MKNEDVKEAEEEEAIEEYAAHIKRKNTGGKREKKWKNQTKENDLNLSARWFCHSVEECENCRKEERLKCHSHRCTKTLRESERRFTVLPPPPSPT